MVWYGGACANLVPMCCSVAIMVSSHHHSSQAGLTGTAFPCALSTVNLPLARFLLLPGLSQSAALGSR